LGEGFSKPHPFSFCPYSPKCVEGEFSEVHIHDPASPIHNEPGSLRYAPPLDRSYIHVVVLDNYAVRWMRERASL
jgi:hypothetical protein